MSLNIAKSKALDKTLSVESFIVGSIYYRQQHFCVPRCYSIPKSKNLWYNLKEWYEGGGYIWVELWKINIMYHKCIWIVFRDNNKRINVWKIESDCILCRQLAKNLGYRVKSKRGTQFRIWALNILKEYMRKGFALDDERLKNLGGGGYFKELLERIRDIRASEKVFYRQVLEIYATSIDYDPRAEIVLR